MATNTSSDQTQLCGLISQRNIGLQLTGPPPRYNPISPYPAYTKYQLDMRRKAEILQYNKQSTQTSGKTTKAKKWSQLVNGPFQNNTTTIVTNTPIYDTSGINIIGNTFVTQIYNLVNNCPMDLYLPTSTTACDVPGPPINLQYDPDVPLYNYATNNNALSVIDIPENTKPWQSYTSNNIFLLNPYISSSSLTNENTIVTLYIQNVDNSSYNYLINSPIGLSIAGDVVGNDGSGNVSINGYVCNVYYNDNVAYTFSSTINNLSTLRFSTRTKNTGSTLFNGSIYVGNLTIPNIDLLTTNGFIYNIKISFNLSVSIPTFNYNNYVIGVYANVFGINTYQANNCILNTIPIPPPFQDFAFSGT